MLIYARICQQPLNKVKAKLLDGQFITNVHRITAMPDMSLKDMLYYLLEYSKEGMTAEAIMNELHKQFGWDRDENRLLKELQSKSTYVCTESKWKLCS